MINAVIYARYSSDNQREESITAQIRACTEYCQAEGYQIVKTYTDEARSATTDDRPEFQRMIRDAETGLFNVIIIHKLDRFARNRYDSAYYKRELRIAGVTLESVLERLDGSPESIILESVIEGFAEYYSANLAREAMKGMKENAYQCRHNGGQPPLGYDVQDQKYIINEQEAAAIKLIFSLYTQGIGYNRIIDELNLHGYKTKVGKPFGKNSIHNILGNEKYAGVYTFNRSAAKQNGKRNHHASKDTSEIIRIPGGIPAIISENVFLEVKEKMQGRKFKKAVNKAKVNYLLGGLVYCGECGLALVGNTITRDGVKYSYYECNNRERTKKCDLPRVKKDYLEEYVFEQLKEKLFNPDKLSVLAGKINAHSLEMNAESKEEMEYLHNELKKTTEMLDKYVDLVADIPRNEALSMLDKIRALEKKKAELEFRIADTERRLHVSEITEEQINERLEHDRSRILNRDAGKEEIAKYVKKITVGKNTSTVELILDISGGGGPYRTISKTDSILFFPWMRRLSPAGA